MNITTTYQTLDVHACELWLNPTTIGILSLAVLIGWILSLTFHPTVMILMPAGWFYSWGRGSGDANLLLCQIAGIGFIILWTIGTMLPFFWLLNYMNWLRVDALEEMVGMDLSHHGGKAYDYSEPKQEDVDRLQDSSTRRRAVGRQTPLAMEPALSAGDFPDSPVQADAQKGYYVH